MKAKNNLQAFKTNPTKSLNRPISFCFVHEYDTVTGNGLDSRFLVKSFEGKKEDKKGGGGTDCYILKPIARFVKVQSFKNI